MAHLLDKTTGENAMAYVGTEGTPWHGLGQAVREGASIAEIRDAAKLNWRAEVAQAQFVDSKDHVRIVKETKVVYRSDTLDVLTVTGPNYIPTQNDEVLNFFQEYVDAGDMFIDTAGALQGGKVIWALAKMKESFTLQRKDKVEGRVLFMNPHIYGKGMIIKLVHERVVCHNTLTAALSEGGGSVKIWHNREFTNDVAQSAKKKLGIAREKFHAFKDDAKALSEMTLNHEDAIRVLGPVFDVQKDTPRDELPKTMDRIIELWDGAGLGASLPSAKGTAWGLLNGVTQYFDHEYGRTNERRLQYSWLGSGDVLKRKAMSALLEEGRAAA